MNEFLHFAPTAAWPFVHILDLAHIPGINHLINVTTCVCCSFINVATSQLIESNSFHQISVLSIGLPLCMVALVPRRNRLRAVDIRLRRQITLSALGARLHPPLFFGPLEYFNLTAVNGSLVFNWLLALSGLSTLFTWPPSISATSIFEKYEEFRPTRSRNSRSASCLVSGRVYFSAHCTVLYRHFAH